MKLEFDVRQIKSYKSKSQIARVLTETWVRTNVYCANCGQEPLDNFENNRPVADFFCGHCEQQFELKSKQDKIGQTILGGAYQTMIDRISSTTTPNFFLLSYDGALQRVKTFLVIPRHFFTAHLVKPRNPLAVTAKRAGWQGCTIDLDGIPRSGKIFYVRDGIASAKCEVLAQWQKTAFLQQTPQSSKGWLLDVLGCIDSLPAEFMLKDLYAFESHLSALHPENSFVRDKIRQQLQALRDKGYIKFVARGRYQKI